MAASWPTFTCSCSRLDAGAFQTYYKGPLAIDSGVYQGSTGAYGSEHHMNYSKRTVAHNCMLVYDPNEQFLAGKASLHNDGGQKIINGNREPRSLEDVLANYRSAEVLGEGVRAGPAEAGLHLLEGRLHESLQRQDP